MIKHLVRLLILLSLASANAFANSYKDDADLIRKTYESELYSISYFKMAHYGLRMYRQNPDPKFKTAIWVDLARVASQLNTSANEMYTDEQIKAYSLQRSENYQDTDPEREILRRAALKKNPEYVYLAVGLLGSMARADEYGLKHKNDEKLHAIFKRYDFKRYVTDPQMIEAWAGQMANHVYWLKQLGEQDVTEAFSQSFRQTYPDSKDPELSEQQYNNKLYGLTHIIFGASEYYQHSVKEENFQWIYDYFRNNIDTLLNRAKEDVIAEVGITFLLAGLDNDPALEKVRKHIQASIDPKEGMIPSKDGGFELTYGEHRNVLAIMLLDWQGVNSTVNIQQRPELFKSLPYGLIKKD
ncbi:DUF3541 domain-containing protein [Endozoicomonas numazuensis]|uniref:DUF3541 domain-containing protein n=1 Tax=Endozoicomonas numazuensis TaxID=1137799 RepID=A0A081NIT8_9GAMM|nr:DUF3541 domain-containing protein [Endozoicomonas numazuensis]KEQ18361.1 hypothetical protein GZ78_12705 [Endozoicomonas numazuensis]